MKAFAVLSLILLILFVTPLVMMVKAEQCSGQILGDPGFEASTPNGTFPDSGFWKKSTAGGTAGAVCTTRRPFQTGGKR